MSTSPELDPEHTLDASGHPKRSSGAQRNKIEKARDAAQDRRRDESRARQKEDGFEYVDQSARVKAYIAKREAATFKSHHPKAAKDAADALHQVAEKLSAVKAKSKAKSFGDTWTSPDTK